jgi:hypothetical protein
MSSIGVYNNTDKCDERREGDFYPTPWQATEALLLREREYLREYQEIWEPACGDGAISEMLKLHGYHAVSTDLIDRGYGGTLDFLKSDIAPCRAIVTNPPFNVAEDFIRHAWDLGIDYMALLLKANYFHADCRVGLFNERKPARIYPLAWRVDFTGGGANHFDCMWVIWDVTNRSDQCVYMPPVECPEIMGQRAML